MVDVSSPSPEQLEQSRREYAAVLRTREAAKIYQRTNPNLFFRPHNNGQRQFLESRHDIRILIPGNGFGKTTVCGYDLDLLLQRRDPYKPETMPDHPPTCVWVYQKQQQWEIMRPKIERSVFTRGWRFYKSDKFYAWPNEARLFMVSSKSDWTAIQGVELDSVVFDEHPDRDIWVELWYRFRGEESKVRITVAATMTQGLTWFVRELIKPWEKFHREQGILGDQAIREQRHPRIWVWDRGGIEDNPTMGEKDRRHYEEGATSEAEKKVRLKGGYADFNAQGVFESRWLARYNKTVLPGEDGDLIFQPPKDFKPTPGRHLWAGVLMPKWFKWVPDKSVKFGRITVWEYPQADATYCAGADFALGLEAGDFDYMVIGRKSAGGQIYQVAEACGRWGDVDFVLIIFRLCVWYNLAFFTGERQVGLPAMRRLYDEMDYGHLFYNRDDKRIDRRSSDVLGHHKHAGDTILANHRGAVKRGDIIIRSPELLRQHSEFQFRPRSKEKTFEEAHDPDLIASAPEGDNDDGLIATGYLIHGAREVVHFEAPVPTFPEGTAGDVLDIGRVLYDDKQADPDREILDERY